MPQSVRIAAKTSTEQKKADLYDEAAMPPELRKAHQENDKAVRAAYGLPAGWSNRS